jgi:hypothetical protein
MGHTFTLTPDAARQDLVTFLERAAGSITGPPALVAASGHLQVYVGLLFPRGLLDRTPTVLGLRVFALQESQEFDVVVPIDALVARAKAAIERDETEVGTPGEVASLAWAAITPPREGWRRRLGVASSVLAKAAAAGIARVAEAVPGVHWGISACRKSVQKCGVRPSPTTRRFPLERRSQRMLLVSSGIKISRFTRSTTGCDSPANPAM